MDAIYAAAPLSQTVNNHLQSQGITVATVKSNLLEAAGAVERSARRRNIRESMLSGVAIMA